MPKAKTKKPEPMDAVQSTAPAPAVPEWLQRLDAERGELRSKVVGLEKYLFGAAGQVEASQTQVNLLRQQLVHMKSYLTILDLRILEACRDSQAHNAA